MFLFFLSSTLNFRNLSKKTENISSSGARNWTIIGISFAGCFLFALYLIYDLQLIMGENAFSFSFRASLSGTNPCILRMNARGGWPVGKRKGPRRRPDGRGIDVEVERERPQAEKNSLLKKKTFNICRWQDRRAGPRRIRLREPVDLPGRHQHLFDDPAAGGSVPAAVVRDKWRNGRGREREKTREKKDEGEVQKKRGGKKPERNLFFFSGIGASIIFNHHLWFSFFY